METASSSISRFFEADHRSLDSILAGIKYASLREKLAKLEEFDRRLERHIRWEEELLFPAVCAKHPAMADGPVRVMLMEHREIRASKAMAIKALRDGDETASLKAQKEMFQVLSHHNAKEEQMLYPACDQLLSPAEVEALLAKVLMWTES